MHSQRGLNGRKFAESPQQPPDVFPLAAGSALRNSMFTYKKAAARSPSQQPNYHILFSRKAMVFSSYVRSCADISSSTCHVLDAAKTDEIKNGWLDR